MGVGVEGMDQEAHSPVPGIGCHPIIINCYHYKELPVSCSEGFKHVPRADV